MAVLAAAAWMPGLLTPAGPDRSPAYAPFDAIAGSTPPGPEAVHETLVEPRIAGSSASRDATGAEGSARALEPVLRVALLDERGRPVAGRFELEYRRIAPRAGTARARLRAEVVGPEFVLDVAEPGSYGLWLRGSGYVGEAVVAARLGRDEPAVRVELERAVRVGGTIVDARGEPLENVGVWALIRRDAAVVARLEARSDATGAFELELPPRGMARVHVGDPSRPWVPPIDVEGALQDRELDPIRVELFEAEFVVVLADGAPASGARLDGTGMEGGSFSLATDDRGRARVARLPRGRWRVNASLAAHGRESRAVELPLAQDEPVLLVLPR